MEQSNQLLEELLPDSQAHIQHKFGLGSIVLLASFILVTIVIGLQLAQQNATQPASGPAPDFSLTTFSGEEFHLSQYRGRVVVVNFWASWCIPCRDEAPILQGLWDRYREQDVVLVGVAYLDTEQGSRDFIEEFGITYPNGHDAGTRISDAYHITGVPETFVIDQNGEVAFFIPAPIVEGQLDEIIQALLGEVAD